MILADDGSPAARSVIPQAARLAAACGSEVLVIRVSRSAGARPGDLEDGEWERYVSPQGRAAALVEPLEAEPLLSGAVAGLQERGVQQAGSLVLYHDDPGDALVEAARALNADLLVLSSRGESGVRRWVLGSVAEQLLREARETAVLLCPARETVTDAAIRRVMVTLDGSDLAQVALPHAEYLARCLEAELVLLRVTEGESELLAASMPVGAPPVASIPAEAAHEIAERGRMAALAYLREQEASIRARGLERLTTQVVDGPPAEAILNASEALDVDMLVMTTRGRGGLGRLLLGSVADAVARRVERAPVLLVRPPADGEAPAPGSST